MGKEITERDFIYKGIMLPTYIYGYYMLKDNFPELYLILEDYQFGTGEDTGWRIYFTFRDKQKQKIHYSELLECKDKMNKFLGTLPQMSIVSYVYIFMPLKSLNQEVVDPEKEDYFKVRIEAPRRHLIMRDFNKFDYIGYLRKHNIGVVSEE